jgi:hypothetical protein
LQKKTALINQPPMGILDDSTIKFWWILWDGQAIICRF